MALSLAVEHGCREHRDAECHPVEKVGDVVGNRQGAVVDIAAKKR